MRWRIRYQLLLPLLVLLLGVALLCGWMAAAAAQRARNRIEARVRDVAGYLSESCRYPLNRSILEQVKSLSGADYLVLSPHGDAATTFTDALPETVPANVDAHWQSLHLTPTGVVGGQRYLGGGVRLWREPNAGCTLLIFFPESLLDDAVREAVWPFVVLGGSVGMLSVLLAVGLGRHLSRRIGNLERRTRLIAAGDFSPMPLPAQQDEIRDLTQSINEMAGKLAQLQEAIRRAERLRLLGQVGGGLAHQLRNGLTGARLAVQVYLQESGPDRETDALDVALRQLSLLELRLKRFLELGGQENARRQHCSLVALTGEAIDLLRPQCRHAATEVRWQPPADDLPILGDTGQLGQLILNLLTNAAEAAGPGGWVEVSLKRQQTVGHLDTAILEVIDSGPGPPTEIAPRLFEPLITAKPEGVGLGLAVARQAVESHGGWIEWHRTNGCTVFRVVLPIHDRSPVPHG